MSNGVQEKFESPWDGTTFQREKRSGVLLGLGWLQLGYLTVGVVGLLILWWLLPFPWGQIGTLLGAAFLFFTAVMTPAGRPLIEWALYSLTFLVRGAFGFLRFRRGWHNESVEEGEDGQGTEEDQPEPATVDKKGRVKPGKPWQLHLIGEFDELKMYQMIDGSAFVFDPRKREVILTARIGTDKAFDLESLEGREARTSGFKDLLTSVTTLPGVTLTAMSDQTTMVSGRNVESWYQKRQSLEGVQTGKEIDEFLHASLQNAMRREQGMPFHEMWLTVVLSADKLRERGKSSRRGIGGLMETVPSTMSSIEHRLAPTGAVITNWHTPRSLSAIIRGAFDPDASVEISERTGDFAGVAPTSAGPMAVDVHRGHLSSDSGLHRTYMISEWPQFGARFGFLDKFVFLGDFRHTVTVIMRPRDQRKALQKVRGRKATHHASERTRRKLGGADSLEHRRELDDLEAEERELVEGAAALQQVGLITVTGRDEMELEAHSTALLSVAPEAGCEVRPLWWQQDSGFVAAALPLGRIDVR